MSPPARRADRPSIAYLRSSWRVLRMLAPDRHLVAAVVALSVVSVALALPVPLLLGSVTDLVVSSLTSDRGLDLDAVAHRLVAALGAAVAAFLVNVQRGRLLARVAEQLGLRARERATDKIMRLPLAHVDTRDRGDLLSVVTNDIGNLTGTLQRVVGELVRAVVALAGALALMLWLSPLLTLVAVASVLASVIAAFLLARRAQPEFVRQWTGTGGLSAHVEETYSGHAVVRAFGRQAAVFESFREHNRTLYSASTTAGFLSRTIQPAMDFVANLGYVLLAVVGGLRVTTGNISIGDFQAFIQYTDEFNVPLSQAASLANELQSGLASAERLFAFLDADEQRPEPTFPRVPREAAGRVEFEGVSFRYSPDVPLIDNLSLRIEPGQVAAIVGPSGAGKTTLVNLLVRFSEVTGGRILLDGIDTTTMTTSELRGRVGMVLQEPWLFRGSIADNIAYGAEAVTREDVRRAARAAHLEHVVRALPDGLDSVVDPEDTSLSAGEMQLVTIARAFVSRRPVLVLDEATSAVDTRTELLVQRAMARLREDRTSLVIAHRLSTIRDADVILVMESGRIVETGRHDDLLARGGAYRRLYRAQFPVSRDEAS